MTFKTTLIAAGALIAASAATLSSAQAHGVNFSLQFGTPNAGVYYTHNYRKYRDHRRYYRHALSPREVRRALRHYGFRRIRGIDRRGRVYVARAVGYNGYLYKVRVHAYTGRLIGQRVIRSARHHRGHYRHWR